MINYNGFDSQKVLDFNSRQDSFKLDIKGTSILYALKVFLSNDKLVSKEVDGEIFYWVNQTVFLPEIAMLGITTKRGLQKQLGVLESLGLISRYTDKNAGNYSYFRITDLCKSFYIDEETIKNQKSASIVKKNIPPYEQKDITLMNNSSQAPYEQQFTTKEISNNIEINNNKDKYSSSMVSAKEEERDFISLPEVKDLFFANINNAEQEEKDFFINSAWNKLSTDEKQQAVSVLSNQSALVKEKRLSYFLLNKSFLNVKIHTSSFGNDNYKPNSDTVFWNESANCYQYPFDMDMLGDNVDGYTSENRPDNSCLLSDGRKYGWVRSKKEWIENAFYRPDILNNKYCNMEKSLSDVGLRIVRYAQPMDGDAAKAYLDDTTYLMNGHRYYWNGVSDVSIPIDAKPMPSTKYLEHYEYNMKQSDWQAFD